MSEKQKVNQLVQIVEDLQQQAKNANKPISKIIKIKDADSIVLQLNAIPSNGNVRVSLTLHRRANFKKQIGIVSDDYKSLYAIAKFLEKYKDTLDKYIQFSINRQNNNNNVVEMDLEEEEQTKQSKQTQTTEKKRPQHKSVDEEF
ncbi:putative single-stranded DNA-binding protein [Sulfolobales Beppu rod-shaped virus 1]|uniref:Putative single-stranded DNA-binding protein n=1 Tax=Sulfolobales Beppu rod-shaped virus 1 TaxID=2493121 RepID=A0A3S8NFA6_9VIRU|nr:putative single-stranded DNA-binding protein [Sulfolobales Beppu rod-shaped virus 1]AZI75902.1 putative single-stranded DNA-binding protein [Sulfolobales Beppu rod-shaped virus 1]